MKGREVSYSRGPRCGLHIPALPFPRSAFGGGSLSNASPPFPASHRLDRAFHLVFAIVAIVGVAGGFLPRLSTIFSGERPWPPLIVHVHAALLYGWIALLLIQIGLIRTRAVALHRKLGLLGAVLAVAMVLVSAWMAIDMAGFHLVRGSTRALNFLPVPLTDIAAFAVLIGAAIALHKDSPAHKRLVVLATTVVLGAGYGRMNLYDIPKMPDLPLVEPLVETYGMLWAILVGMIVYDLATRRRVHHVYLVGIPFVLAMQLIATLLVIWPGWPAFARATFNLG